MGIKGLSKLLQQMTDGSGIKANEVKSYFGRKIAIDASMALYQFLIAVRQSGTDGSFQQLTNDEGQVTSHLIGILYRTIRMMENGIKPVYVFDGKPPDFKSHELKKRKEAREKAQVELKEAEKNDDTEKMAKMQRRLVKVDKTHVKESQRLLDCLGVPWVASPGEAEAQCAVLVKAGVVYGTATEDMDALTFGTPTLLRQLTYSDARKMPVLEFNLEKLLKSLNVTMDQFIDICILCGCDYIPSIRGIGPIKAFQFITKYGNIETLLENLESKYIVPEGFFYEQARILFKKPNVVEDVESLDIKWRDANETELVNFLVKEKHFSLDRVQNAYKRILKCKGKASQRRMDSFFTFQGVSTSTTKVNKAKQKFLESQKKSKKKTKGRKSSKKGNKAGVKAGPYANVNLNGKSKTKTKTKKSAKKSKKSAKKSKKKKKTTKSMIGKKRKHMDSVETDQNENQNENQALPDINSVSLATANGNNNNNSNDNSNSHDNNNGNNSNSMNVDKTENDKENDNNENKETKSNSEDATPTKAKNILTKLDNSVKNDNDNNNNNNNNGNSDATEKLAGFDDFDVAFDHFMDICEQAEVELKTKDNNNDICDDIDFESSEPPRKKARLMKNSSMTMSMTDINAMTSKVEASNVIIGNDDEIEDIDIAMNVMDNNNNNNNVESEITITNESNDCDIKEIKVGSFETESKEKEIDIAMEISNTNDE